MHRNVMQVKMKTCGQPLGCPFLDVAGGAGRTGFKTGKCRIAGHGLSVQTILNMSLVRSWHAAWHQRNWLFWGS